METEKSLQRTVNKTSKLVVYIGVMAFILGLIAMIYPASFGEISIVIIGVFLLLGGIASFILSKSGGFNGIGFGGSSNVAKKILMEQSKFWSGMEFVFLQNEMAKIFNLPQTAEILITSVSLRV